MTSTEESGLGTEESTALVPARAEASYAPTKNRRCKAVVQPWLTCSKDDIKPYKKYKVLYGERKFARDFTKQEQNLSFSDDIPVEIRLQIYNHLFNIPSNFFELWAPDEWTRPRRGHPDRNFGFKSYH